MGDQATAVSTGHGQPSPGSHNQPQHKHDHCIGIEISNLISNDLSASNMAGLIRTISDPY